jgi:hypothetical protein
MSMKTDIVEKSATKRVKLDKYIKNLTTPATEVYAYSPFPAGNLPKVLVKKDDKKTYYLHYTLDADRVPVLAAVNAARNCKSVGLIWLVKFVESKKRIEPAGVAIVALSSISIVGGAELMLE